MFINCRDNLISYDDLGQYFIITEKSAVLQDRPSTYEFNFFGI